MTKDRKYILISLGLGLSLFFLTKCLMIPFKGKNIKNAHSSWLRIYNEKGEENIGGNVKIIMNTSLSPEENKRKNIILIPISDDGYEFDYWVPINESINTPLISNSRLSIQSIKGTNIDTIKQKYVAVFVKSPRWLKVPRTKIKRHHLSDPYINHTQFYYEALQIMPEKVAVHFKKSIIHVFPRTINYMNLENQLNFFLTFESNFTGITSPLLKTNCDKVNQIGDITLLDGYDKGVMIHQAVRVWYIQNNYNGNKHVNRKLIEFYRLYLSKATSNDYSPLDISGYQFTDVSEFIASTITAFVSSERISSTGTIENRQKLQIYYPELFAYYKEIFK